MACKLHRIKIQRFLIFIRYVSATRCNCFKRENISTYWMYDSIHSDNNFTRQSVRSKTIDSDDNLENIIFGQHLVFCVLQKDVFLSYATAAICTWHAISSSILSIFGDYNQLLSFLCIRKVCQLIYIHARLWQAQLFSRNKSRIETV